VVLLKALSVRKAKQVPLALLALMVLKAPQDRKATQARQAPLARRD
jgi:hypothetical protein